MSKSPKFRPPVFAGGEGYRIGALIPLRDAKKTHCNSGGVAPLCGATAPNEEKRR